MAQYPSDKDLVIMLKDPAMRRKAIEQMVAKYSSRLYWQIRHVVVYHDDADDVLQNTFLKAWGGLDTFRGEAMLSTWRYRIAANESVAFLQRKNDTLSLDDPEAAVGGMVDNDPYFDGDEADNKLKRAVLALPPRQRMVFSMKYYDGLKYEEIARRLETSEGSLKASYHIAVKKIEEFFRDND